MYIAITVVPVKVEYVIASVQSLDVIKVDVLRPIAPEANNVRKTCIWVVIGIDCDRIISTTAGAIRSR
jgi:hypothetical protein